MNQHTTRSQFIANVRAALGRSLPLVSADVTPPAVDDAVARLTSSGDDLVETFAARAASVGMDVRRCPPEALTKTLIQLLDELHVTKLVIAVGSVPQATEFSEAFRRRNIAVPDWRGDRAMAADFEADAGLTDVAAAIAETGSIVYRGDAGHGRGLMLVPPVHIAIVRPADIVPDLLDWTRRIDDVHHTQLPAAQTIITGPSKTADIEGVLVTGVHGPGKVVVLLVNP
ncbi:MAG: LUD domain-containing protein [Phycisphaeraceae bacterium]